MHPCCWGNLFQGFVQLVPFLAVALLAGRKFVEAAGRAWLPRRQKAIQVEGRCCCPSAEGLREEATLVEIGR